MSRLLEKFLESYLVLLLLQIPISGGLLSGSSVTLYLYAGIDVLYFFVAISTCKKVYEGKAPESKLLLPIALFFMWAMLSASWSISDDVYYGLTLLARDGLRFATLYLFLINIPDKHLNNALSHTLKIVAIGYPLIFMLTARYSFDMESGQGRLMYAGFKDANASSRDLIVLFLLVLWAFLNSALNRGTLQLIGLALILVSFMLSFSKTAFVALALSLSYIFILNRGISVRKIKYIALLFIGFFGIAVYRLDYFLNYFYFVQGGSALQTLSGRTGIWDIFFDNYQEKIFFGHGVNSFKVYSSEVLANSPATTHNEVMNIVFSYGLVGTFFSILVYYTYFSISKPITNSLASRIPRAILLFFLIIGLTESNIVGFVFSPFLLLLSTSLLRVRF